MANNRTTSDDLIATPSALYETKTKTILFATDLSPTCAVALKWATALARTLDARLLIVHVEQPGVPYGGGEVYSDHVFDQHSRTLLKMLEQVKPSDPEVPYSQRLASGDPAAEILRIANQESVDMIVMSTHGRSGLPRVLNGSVAENVIRHANCPVLIFKAPLTVLRYQNKPAG
ncbi:MAG TPA: universal stress protein [Pirellulales bacterium]|nr:universal stress protein [Pirellulales bacterium]